MASPNEPSSSKRRLGRRRLPPLEPGPALQFVVANHPDQFRAGKTMRHVRSHVMYKHRTERKTSATDRIGTSLRRSASEYASSTPSPAMTSSDASASDIDYLIPPQSRPRSGTWTGAALQFGPYAPSPSTLRTLIHHILTSTQGVHARSAPPIFEYSSEFPFPGPYGAHSDLLDVLKQQYLDNASFFSQDRAWIQSICTDHMSFLSHVSVSCVYQDLADHLWQDSGTTVQAKTQVLSAIAGRLETNDATILTILHLLLSEAGGDDAAFQVHHQGLQGLIHRRGGLNQLPWQLATHINLHLMTLAMLKGLPKPPTSPSYRLTRHAPQEHQPCISPFRAAHKAPTLRHNSCASQTHKIINDMRELTQAFIRNNHNTTSTNLSHQYGRMYEHLLFGILTLDPTAPDWIYESVRLAGLIYTHAILHRTTLATSGSRTYQNSSSRSTMLYALLHAVEHTDTTNSWGDMRGVLLWICLVGGAASTGPIGAGDRQATHSPTLWARKCFSLWAIRAVGSSGFEHAEEISEELSTGLRVRNILDEKAT